RALLRSQTRNSVEKMLIVCVEAAADGYGRLREDPCDSLSNADEEPLHEAAASGSRLMHENVGDDEERSDGERGPGMCEETWANSPEGRVALAELIEAFAATLKPSHHKVFELLKVHPVEQIIAETGCSNVDISRIRADFRTFLMNA